MDRVCMPEDGFVWRKYGQKFIRNIRKNRSYFKCQKKSCGARKRVEWCNSDPQNLRVIYDGSHSHPPPISSKTSDDDHQNPSSSIANQYNLLTQVLRGLNDTTTT
ncbi:hypothetical protein AMTRI_Chr03g55680 [Amborella trichopoda]|uniref:WRKY domain-containing protein n=1 Tax=Amborella trichopoda TaxID=13333 RepID=W1NEF1_AMBTC|nr:hypothetical protein AMTR_s00004p00067720 [Amborella trichopoda]